MPIRGRSAAGAGPERGGDRSAGPAGSGRPGEQSEAGLIVVEKISAARPVGCGVPGGRTVRYEQRWGQGAG